MLSPIAAGRLEQGDTRPLCDVQAAPSHDHTSAPCDMRIVHYMPHMLTYGIQDFIAQEKNLHSMSQYGCNVNHLSAIGLMVEDS